MRNEVKRVPTRFKAVTRFEPQLSVKARGRTARQEALEQLKRSLLSERLDETWGDRQEVVTDAANKAAALAWLTAYPTLVFPLLFEEQADAALAVADRQEEVSRTSRELLAV